MVERKSQNPAETRSKGKPKWNPTQRVEVTYDLVPDEEFELILKSIARTLYYRLVKDKKPTPFKPET